MTQEPVLHTLLPWSELIEAPRITLKQFREVLNLYSRSTLLMACSRLGVLFNYGTEGQTMAAPGPTAYYIERLFPPMLAKRVQYLADQGRAIFYQGQLRFLSAEILRLDAENECEELEIDESELGRLLLMAGEMLYSPFRSAQIRLMKWPV